LKGPPEELDPLTKENAVESWKTLGQILRQAKEKQEREQKEKALKEAGIDLSKSNVDLNEGGDGNFFDDLEAKLAGRLVKREKVLKCIMYPEDRFRRFWDIVMTL